MTRQETKINQIVGIKDGELYVLEYVFKHSDDFKGATGYSMGTITQEYIDEMNDIDMLCEEWDYLWREAVQAGNTDEGLREWMENWQYASVNYDGYLFPSDDNSFRYETEKLVNSLPEDQKKQLEEVFGVMGEDYATWNCSGCGRCFNANDEWDVIFRPDLLELIKEYES